MIHIKTKVFKNIKDDVKKRFGTLNYEVERPLVMEKL